MELLDFVLLLSLCAASLGINDVTVVNKKNVLNRKKRYLVFPPGSNFVISFAAVKALTRVQPTGWNVLEELDFPFALPSDTRMFERKNWIGRTKRAIRSSLRQGMTKTGYNGTACVNKIICDMKQYAPLRGKSMMKDIILAVFSYTEEEFDYERCQYSGLECPLSILDYVLEEVQLMDSS